MSEVSPAVDWRTLSNKLAEEACKYHVATILTVGHAETPWGAGLRIRTDSAGMVQQWNGEWFEGHPVEAVLVEDRIVPQNE